MSTTFAASMDDAGSYAMRRASISIHDPVGVFKAFSSERKDGHDYMNVNDFVRALMSLKYGWHDVRTAFIK